MIANPTKEKFANDMPVYGTGEPVLARAACLVVFGG
jgi:hypothetical protein